MMTPLPPKETVVPGPAMPGPVMILTASPALCVCNASPLGPAPRPAKGDLRARLCPLESSMLGICIRLVPLLNCCELTCHSTLFFSMSKHKYLISKYLYLALEADLAAL